VRGRDVELGRGELLWTIDVNEIVRDFVRTRIRQEDPTGALEAALIETLAICTRDWIVWFIETDAMDQARPLITHARHIADLGLTLREGSYGLALLWGNLADVLLLREQFEPAEEYLRAELKFLLSESENREITLVQTLISLGRLLVQRDALNAQGGPEQEVIPLLERAASLIASIDPEKLTSLRAHLIVASHITILMGRHSQRSSSAELLQEVFDAYMRMLSPGEDAPVATRLHRFEELLRCGDFMGAESLARQWLSEIGPTSMAFPSCLCYLIEALALQQKWSALSDPVAKLKRSVRAYRVPYLAISQAIVNSGMSVVIGISTGSSGSAVALRELIDLADEYETLHHVFNSTDSGCLYALRTADAFARGRMNSFSEFLEKVDFRALRLADPRRYLVWSAVWSAALKVINATAEHGVAAEPDRPECAARRVPEGEVMSPPFALGDYVTRMYSRHPECNPEFGEVEIGEDEDGTKIVWTLHKKGEGVRNCLVIGPPRSGKTSLLWVLLNKMVKSGKILPFVVDYTERSDFRNLADTAHYPHYIEGNVGDAEALLGDAVKIVQDRDAAGGFRDLTGERLGIFILIDGADRLFAQSDRSLQAAEFIASDGPRNSVGVILTVEGAGLDHLGGSLKLRDSLAAANKVAFVGADQEA
jgi:tetratricopeptide (TPR) repeat protein